MNKLFSRFTEIIKPISYKILDFIAPMEAILRSKVQTSGRITNKVDKNLYKKSVFFRKISDRPEQKRISKPIPDKPVPVVFLSLLVVVIPQVPLLIFHNRLNLLIPDALPKYFYILDEVKLAAGILASILGLFFVLAVFLFENVRGREFEQRVVPIYLSYTRSRAIITFGLISLISIVFNSLLLPAAGKLPEEYAFLTAWNIFIFFINISLLLFFLWKTLNLIDPNVLQEVLLDNLRRSTKANTLDVIEKRVWSHIVNKQESDNYKIAFRIIRPKPNWSIVSLKIDKLGQIYEFADINLDMIELAGKRASRLIRFPKLFQGLLQSKARTQCIK